MGRTFRPVPGVDDIPARMPPWWRRFNVYWRNDWPAVFQPAKYNWTNFTFIDLGCELEWCMGTAEVTFCLLGFGTRLTWYWPHETREEMARQVRLIQTGMLETVPLEAVVATQDRDKALVALKAVMDEWRDEAGKDGPDSAAWDRWCRAFDTHCADLINDDAPPGSQ